MLLAKQMTWNLSACVLLSHDFLVLYLYNVESTGSMGDIKIFAVPGWIPLPNRDPETQRYFLLL
jgi:hypothetical protein